MANHRVADLLSQFHGFPLYLLLRSSRAIPFLDAHCHLADPRFDPIRDEVIARARARSITGFIQGGVGPEDWELQRKLKAMHPQAVWMSFGVHPWWVAAHTDEECRAAIQLLPTMLHEASALGEVGIDHGPRVSADSYERQEWAFREQITLADQKPIVLHVVKAHDLAVSILSRSRLTGGIVHAFTGSYEVAKRYVDLGLLISVGGPVARTGYESLKKALKKLPVNSWVLESDSPDQPPPGYQGQLNEPESLWEIAGAVSQLLGQANAEWALENSRKNLIAAFPALAAAC